MTRVVGFLLLSALGASGAGLLEVRAPGYGWQNGEYTVSHVFIDEVAGTTADIEVRFDPQAAGVTDVEVFTNLNRRDLATADKNMDGEHDGILPVEGNSITDLPGDTDTSTGHYYIPHSMVCDAGLGLWTLAIPASRTGAYRLTARFKAGTNPDWQWHGLRDHCVVVSPVEARDIRMYEVNVLNVEASGNLESQRSTWEDLSDRLGAIHVTPGRANDWKLSTMQALGVNWLWFQPYHPSGVDGRDTGGHSWVWNGGAPYEDLNLPYDLGSPYSVKNFWEIEPRTSAQYDPLDPVGVGRAKAMASFQEFVADADAAGIQIMPDAAFNHTAFDVELGPKGAELFEPDGSTWDPIDEIRGREARFFSRDYNSAVTGSINPFVDGGENYGDRATNTFDIALAPDRFDFGFGKWVDVKDVYFGRYDSLVEFNDGAFGSEVTSKTNEGDWFDFSDSEFNSGDFVQGGESFNVTRQVWKYFGSYVPYWLEKTRPAGQNRNSLPSDGNENVQRAWDNRGIDGLRCDFGQGLPPRCWEYIINRAKSHKWNFVFMSESLDGGAVTYRSGRHFDVLNENLVFTVKRATDTWGLRNAYEARRTSCGQAPVLLNTTSHDEENSVDPWAAVARYAANSTMDGAPMIFAGQELGIRDFFGYDLMELNGGKWVPHFKTHNSMMPAWSDTNFWNDQLSVSYADLNRARMTSPALRSGKRWFLDGDGSNGQVHAVAKYEQEGVSPMFQDVVMAFVNLDLGNDQGDNFKIPEGLAPLLGIEDSRIYNVRNISAYERPPTVTGRRSAYLWGGGISGSELKATGFGVLVRGVPASEAEWDTVPYEAQFLKLIDVTPAGPFGILEIRFFGDDVRVTCNTEPGRWHHLESSPSIDPVEWSAVDSNVQATGATLELWHSGGATGITRFYRIARTVESL